MIQLMNDEKRLKKNEMMMKARKVERIKVEPKRVRVKPVMVKPGTMRVVR